MPDPLPPEFAAALASTAARRGSFGSTVHFFSETSSTNDVAGSLAERGAPEGTTVVASAQSAGRGRLGREWFSPPGAGLYVSVIVRDAAAIPYVTLAGGVAVADGIRAATGLAVEIKWPNDVVVTAGSASGRRRKLAGILAEASTGATGLQHVILGFGINLRTAAYPVAIADRATSIEAELGRAPDAGAVFTEALAALARLVAHLSDGRSESVLAQWRALSPSSRGSKIQWEAPGGWQSGVAAGIDRDGALLVRCGDSLHRIIAGEVRWP
jgi:BirA family biotin operon repressor/biotin-[acetyl-CoA-carboxylase] ligase